MNVDLNQFNAAFFEEAAEHLAALEEGLLRLEDEPNDKELINGIFRSAHSIKGTGAALGFSDIAAFTHHVETLLDKMRQGELHPTSNRVELLLKATDILTGLIDASKFGNAPPDERAAIQEALERQLAVPHDNCAASEEVSFFDAEPSSTATASPEVNVERRKGNVDSIRVSVTKVEDLINLVGELVIANSMAQSAYSITNECNRGLLQEALVGMERTTRQLQEQVMAVRMMPLSTVFRRFPRIVRDLASTLGKEAQLLISGEETELDKQVIEEIGDPLTHLLRNAIDHGIESPEARVAAGKPAVGRIYLRSFHEDGSVIIEVADDGHGIDVNRVREKAIVQGLIEAGDVYSDQEICELIFRPGFSTAEKLTDVSGRGVGMDVVKRNIEALKGSVSVTNQPGVGSCFSIRLPLTMAILDGLTIRLGEEVYVLPLLSVVESLRPSRKQLLTVAERGEMLLVRGETLPLLHLGRLFNVATNVATAFEGLVVIVEHHNRRFGLVIDELLGQLQVVMKNLEANYQRVEGLSGATILGDGRVAFIIDLPGLMRLAFAAA